MARLTYKDKIDAAEQDTVQLVADEARTVAKIDVSQQTRYGLGLGNSENPLQAEGFIYGEIYDDSGSQITNAELIAEVVTKGGNPPQGVQDNELFRFDLTQIDDASDRNEFKRRFIRKGRQAQYWVGYPYEIRFKVEMKGGATATFNPDDGSNALEVDGRYQER